MIVSSNSKSNSRVGTYKRPVTRESIPIRTFSVYSRERFGTTAGKVPLDVGVTCPNRTRGGCIFCQPTSFTPSFLSRDDDVAVQLAKGKEHLLKGRFKKYFGYFQQETCTVMATEQLVEIFNIVLADEDCVGLIISTRPDCVEIRLLEKLSLLIAAHRKECLFELGVQTVHPESLQLLNRNHTFEDFLDCGRAIKSFTTFQLSAHLIFGIPGETEEQMSYSVERICRFGVDALKLHHLQVVRNTSLQRIHERGELELFTLERYIDFLVDIIGYIPPQVTIHRLWATAHPKDLIAPRWNVLTSQLSSQLLKKMREKNVWQGKFYLSTKDAGCGADNLGS